MVRGISRASYGPSLPRQPALRVAAVCPKRAKFLAPRPRLTTGTLRLVPFPIPVAAERYSWTSKSPSLVLSEKRPFCTADTHFVVLRNPPNANRCTESKFDAPLHFEAAS